GESVKAARSAVDETGAAISEFSNGSEAISEQLRELDQSMNVTARSVGDMDESIAQVERDAERLAGLSRSVVNAAAAGAQTFQRTVEGIDRIKASSQVVSDAIEALVERIADVGGILKVIDDVARQIKVLAFNAGILAA